jgi:hypothetical protein
MDRVRIPNRLTNLHLTEIKGNVSSATPGHGGLQHPDVLADIFDDERVGLEKE